MKSNRRIVFPRPSEVVVVADELPSPADDEVLIETECSAISSGTETTCLRGGFASTSHWQRWVHYPWEPGYQNIGHIVALGRNVSELELGQRMATHSPHAQFVTVPARRCIPVPEGVSSEEAAWFTLSAIAQIALTKADLTTVSRAAVVGLGVLGQLTVQWLRVSGVDEVIPIGRSPWRVELAGAVPQPNAQVPPFTQLTIDAAGESSALRTAFEMTMDHGVVILVGDPPDPSEQRLTSDLLMRGLTLIGSHFMDASMDDPAPPGSFSLLTHAQLGAAYFTHVTAGSLDVRSLISHRLSPEEAPHAYQLAAAREPGTMGIVFDWT